MSRPEELRLRDVLAAIETIRAHLAAGEFDQKTNDAILYNLVVIGEAAARIGDETRERAPEIPWTSIVGLRNLVTHEYFRVDLEVIEDIVKTSLGPLEATVNRLLHEK
ncbi:MAG: HepT-like ribonuclease domain-containing protein [Thermoleophilaceae bacterium]